MAMGRPRGFDTDKALEEAMEVFWRHGYEGATIAELTAAMGINPPSLYAAFGSKEGLLKAALDRYAAKRAEFMRDVLSAPTAREVVERLNRDAGYDPVYTGPLANAARQESIIDVIFAISEGMGEYVYRFAPIEEL